MLAQINLKQAEQVWVVAVDAALAEEWQNNGCCAESLQPRLAPPAGDRPSMPDDPGDWWPGQCAL